MDENQKLQYIEKNYPAKGLMEIAKHLGWFSADPIRTRLRKLGISLIGKNKFGRNKEEQKTISIVKSLSHPNVSNGYIAAELNKTGLRNRKGSLFNHWIIRKIRVTNGFPLSKVRSGNDRKALTFKDAIHTKSTNVTGVSKIL